MSREDVNALERVYARWRTGDFSTTEIFDPDVEVRWSPAGLDTAGTTRGLAELGAGVQRWFEALDDVRFEAAEYSDLGDQVHVSVVLKARGRGTGIEVAGRYGHLWTFRDGRAVRLEDADPAPPRPARPAGSARPARPAHDEPGVAAIADAGDDIAVVRRFFVELNEAMAGKADLDKVVAGYLDSSYAGELGVFEGTIQGPHGFANYIRGQLAIVDGMRIEPEQLLAVGDRVVMPFCLRGRARETGLPMSFRYTQIFQMRDGRIVHSRMHSNVESALHALERTQRSGEAPD